MNLKKRGDKKGKADRKKEKEVPGQSERETGNGTMESMMSEKTW